MSERISELSVMRDCLRRAFHAKEMRLGAYTDACEIMKSLDRRERDVVELIEASARAVRAFESLGRASGVMPNLEAHRECEAALAAQKDALARIAPNELHDKAAELRGRGE